MAAKKKLTDPAKAEELATAYYDAMREQKRQHLPLEDAVEVTARQRKEDEAAGFTPYLDDAEAETLAAV